MGHSIDPVFLGTIIGNERESRSEVMTELKNVSVYVRESCVPHGAAQSSLDSEWSGPAYLLNCEQALAPTPNSNSNDQV